MAGQRKSLQKMGEKLLVLVQCAEALKEDLQVALASEPAEVSENQSSSQEVPTFASNEATQCRQPPLPPQQLGTVSSRAGDATRLGSNRDQDLPMLDAILKNQEALRQILINQDTLKGLVEGLLKAMTGIEGRVHTIEREMGLLSRFTEELNAVDTETHWG